MKHVKLFENWLNEDTANIDSSKPEMSAEDVIKALGEKPTVEDTASFCYENYDKITGLNLDDRDEEMEFPGEVEAVIDHYGFDYDDFSQAWGN
jgi:hypothetical protein